MHTLTVTLADLEGVTHGTTEAHTSVKVSARYSREVILTDGTIIPVVIKNAAIPGDGVAAFEVYESDSVEVDPDYRDFAIVVEATIKHGHEAGGTYQRTVQVTTASPEPVPLGSLSSTQGVPARWTSIDALMGELATTVATELNDTGSAAHQAVQDASAGVAVAAVEGELADPSSPSRQAIETVASGYNADTLAAAEAAQTSAEAAAADAQTALAAQFMTQDEGVATLIEDEVAGPQTASALTARLASAMDLLAELPAHYITVHRTGPGEAPENTLGGIRHCIDAGVPMVEIDVQVTSDGVPILMHNPTVDHATNGTGDVSTFTAAEIKKLRVDCLPGWPHIEAVPTLDEALSLCKGRIIPVIEMKDPQAANRQKYYAAVKAHDMTRSAVILSGVDYILDEAKAQGFAVWYLADASNYAAGAAAGYDFIRLHKDESDATFTDAVATGAHIIMAGDTRRSDRDRAWSLGVQGVATDYPEYMAADSALSQTTASSWATGYVGAGTMPAEGDPAVAISNGAAVLNPGGAVYPGAITPTPLSSWTLTVEARWTTLPTAVGDDIVFDVGFSTDRHYTNSGGDFGDGYRCQISAAGSMILFKQTAGVGGANLGSAVSAPMSVGAWDTFVVTLTPGGVTFRRPSTGDEVTYSEARSLGGYVRILSNSSTGVIEVRNLRIDPA